jgi:hypothetical protein
MAIIGAPADWVRRPSAGSDREGHNKPATATGLGEHKATTHERGAHTYGHTPAYDSPEGKAHREGLNSRPSATPDNPKVMSKNIRRYGEDVSRLHLGTDLTSTGKQPADRIDRDPDGVPPSLPVTHVGQVMAPHVEQVGWLNGKHTPATHPVSGAAGKTNATMPHKRLEPTGQAHSASGGKHGKPQTRPASQGHGGVKRPVRSNHPIDAEPQRRGKSTGFNR